MTDPSERTGFEESRVAQHQIVSGIFADNRGIAGSNINGDVNYYSKDRVEDAVRHIDGSEAGVALALFQELPLEIRGVVLCGVRFDKAISMLARMWETEGQSEILACLAGIDENRLVEFLGPEGMDLQLSTEVVSTLPAERVHDLLARLGAAHPALAAYLVERLAAAEPAAGRNTGPRAVSAVLPADCHFLNRLPPTRSTVSVLASLPEDKRRNLLLEFPPQDLRDCLILADGSSAEPLIEVLPEDRAVQELNQLTSDQLAPLLASLSADRWAQLTQRISSHVVGAALTDGAVDGAPWLEHMDRSHAAEILGRMQPAQAAAYLRLVRTGTAAGLLRSPSVQDSWLAEVLAALPARLRAALLDRIATNNPALACRLREVLPEVRQPASTGWPRVDAVLTMFATIDPSVHRLSSHFRGTERLSTALGQEAVDARELWRAMRQSSAPRPINYQAQRNHLAVALLLALIAIVFMAATR